MKHKRVKPDLLFYFFEKVKLLRQIEREYLRTSDSITRLKVISLRDEIDALIESIDNTVTPEKEQSLFK